MGSRAWLLGGVLLATLQTAAAADTGFYFGVLGGQADYEFAQPRIPVAVLPGGFVPTLPPDFSGPPAFLGGVRDPVFSVAINTEFAIPMAWMPGSDDSDAAWGALAGYRMHRYAAVELSYLHLGTLHETRDILIGSIFGPPTSVPLKRELETRGPALSVLGLLPLSDSWDLYLRAGVIFADMEASSRLGDSNTASTTFGSEDLLWGGGVQFHWRKHWSARLDFQRFENVGDTREAGEADIDLLSLGVLYRL